FNIDSLSFTPLALRIAPAIIGVLTVWGVYLLGKEMFSKNVGLLASATMAVSAWHIQFSRNGFRAIMLPLALSFMFYFFFRAYKEGKLKDYLWFAVFMAIGFYTYLSIRMLPFVFIAFLVWVFIFDKGFIKRNFKNLMYAGALFIVLLVPLFVSFVGDISLLAGRASTSIFNPDLNEGSWLMAFWKSVYGELTMFNFKGDPNFRHNLGGSPMLDIVTGIFFWIGILISVIRFKKLEYFILIAWFGAMSLPMVLTAEGIPHALRIVGTMPVVFLWIALGIDWVAEKIRSINLRYVFVGAVILAATFFGFKKYFIDFPSMTEAREAYSEDMVIMAYDIRKAPEGRIHYAVTGEFGLKTVDYMTHATQPEIIQLETYEIFENFKLTNGKYKIYVTPNWLNKAEREFLKAGYWFDFKPVTSGLDERILFYEYEN
ncbi:glycosyltransferase family 39 protein, partial [Patescibacteria group bacterium]|nr:glycosyltransferase family 39 protein [Patescibacteria group bacterium]